MAKIEMPCGLRMVADRGIHVETDLVHFVPDFAVRYDRWMMLSSFPGP